MRRLGTVWEMWGLWRARGVPPTHTYGGKNVTSFFFQNFSSREGPEWGKGEVGYGLWEGGWVQLQLPLVFGFFLPHPFSKEYSPG